MVAVNITVNIERLVLDGLLILPNERRQVQAALETELARLLQNDGLDADLLTGGTWPSLRGLELDLVGVTGPHELGQRIARTLFFGGIGR